MSLHAGMTACCAVAVGLLIGAASGYAVGARSFEDQVQAATEEAALRAITARRGPPQAAAQETPFTSALGLRRDQ